MSYGELNDYNNNDNPLILSDSEELKTTTAMTPLQEEKKQAVKIEEVENEGEEEEEKEGNFRIKEMSPPDDEPAAARISQQREGDHEESQKTVENNGHDHDSTPMKKVDLAAKVKNEKEEQDVVERESAAAPMLAQATTTIIGAITPVSELELERELELESKPEPKAKPEPEVIIIVEPEETKTESTVRAAPIAAIKPELEAGPNTEAKIELEPESEPKPELEVINLRDLEETKTEWIATSTATKTTAAAAAAEMSPFKKSSEKYQEDLKIKDESKKHQPYTQTSTQDQNQNQTPSQKTHVTRVVNNPASASKAVIQYQHQNEVPDVYPITAQTTERKKKTVEDNFSTSHHHRHMTAVVVPSSSSSSNNIKNNTAQPDSPLQVKPPRSTPIPIATSTETVDKELDSAPPPPPSISPSSSVLSSFPVDNTKKTKNTISPQLHQQLTPNHHHHHHHHHSQPLQYGKQNWKNLPTTIPPKYAFDAHRKLGPDNGSMDALIDTDMSTDLIEREHGKGNLHAVDNITEQRRSKDGGRGRGRDRGRDRPQAEGRAPVARMFADTDDDNAAKNIRQAQEVNACKETIAKRGSSCAKSPTTSPDISQPRSHSIKEKKGDERSNIEALKKESQVSGPLRSIPQKGREEASVKNKNHDNSNVAAATAAESSNLLDNHKKRTRLEETDDDIALVGKKTKTASPAQGFAAWEREGGRKRLQEEDGEDDDDEPRGKKRRRSDPQPPKPRQRKQQHQQQQPNNSKIFFQSAGTTISSLAPRTSRKRKPVAAPSTLNPTQKRTIAQLDAGTLYRPSQIISKTQQERQERERSSKREQRKRLGRDVTSSYTEESPKASSLEDERGKEAKVIDITKQTITDNDSDIDKGYTIYEKRREEQVSESRPCGAQDQETTPPSTIGPFQNHPDKKNRQYTARYLDLSLEEEEKEGRMYIDHADDDDEFTLVVKEEEEQEEEHPPLTTYPPHRSQDKGKSQPVSSSATTNSSAPHPTTARKTISPQTLAALEATSSTADASDNDPLDVDLDSDTETLSNTSPPSSPPLIHSTITAPNKRPATSYSYTEGDILYKYTLYRSDFGPELAEEDGVTTTLGSYLTLEEANARARVEVTRGYEDMFSAEKLGGLGSERAELGEGREGVEKEVGWSCDVLGCDTWRCAMPGGRGVIGWVERGIAPPDLRTASIPDSAFRVPRTVWVALQFLNSAGDEEESEADQEAKEGEIVTLGAFTTPDLANKRAGKAVLGFRNGALGNRVRDQARRLENASEMRKMLKELDKDERYFDQEVRTEDRGVGRVWVVEVGVEGPRN